MTSGAQPPHEVAAFVADFSAPTVAQPPSMAAQIAPLVTLLHWQICAVSGSSAWATDGATRAHRNDQLFRLLGQRDAVQHHLQPRAVIARITDEHATQDTLAVLADDELLVELLAFVDERVSARAGRRAVRVAERGHIDAEQLELRAHVGAAERRVRFACELPRGDLRHLVARRHQAEQTAAPERALADRVDVGVGGAARVVDHDAAARADLEARGARQFVARTDSSGEHDDVCIERRAVVELEALPRSLARHDGFRVLARVHVNAERFDLPAQHGAAAVVDLQRHQSRREFDHMGLQSEIAQRLGGFQPQQAAADHRAHLRAAGSRSDCLRDPRSCGRRDIPAGRVPAPAARRDTSPSRGSACRTRACPRLRA